MAGSSLSVRKGAWTEEEDNLLRKCIEKYGERNWHQVPVRAGLNRCRKSCRLRWVNYLKPDIKRGGFEADEVDLILRLHKLLGNRWALIAGRLPGRTANGIKNYWNTYLRKRPFTSEEHAKEKGQKTQSINIIRPRPRRFSKRLSWMKGNASTDENDIQLEDNLCKASATIMNPQENETVWWESLLAGMVSEQEACDSMGCSGGKGMENLFIRTGNYSPPGPTMREDYYSNTPMNSSGDFSFDMNLWNLFNSDEKNP